MGWLDREIYIHYQFYMKVKEIYIPCEETGIFLSTRHQNFSICC